MRAIVSVRNGRGDVHFAQSCEEMIAVAVAVDVIAFIVRDVGRRALPVPRTVFVTKAAHSVTHDETVCVKNGHSDLLVASAMVAREGGLYAGVERLLFTINYASLSHPDSRYGNSRPSLCTIYSVRVVKLTSDLSIVGVSGCSGSDGVTEFDRTAVQRNDRWFRTGLAGLAQAYVLHVISQD